MPPRAAERRQPRQPPRIPLRRSTIAHVQYTTARRAAVSARSTGTGTEANALKRARRARASTAAAAWTGTAARWRARAGACAVPEPHCAVLITPVRAPWPRARLLVAVAAAPPVFPPAFAAHAHNPAGKSGWPGGTRNTPSRRREKALQARRAQHAKREHEARMNKSRPHPWGCAALHLLP